MMGGGKGFGDWVIAESYPKLAMYFVYNTLK